MTNITILTNKLDNLRSQKTNITELNNTSVLQFIRQKNILKKEINIKKKLYKIHKKEQEINFIYESNSKSWIANPKINCRKFYKLDKKALYKKDLQLYRLGITNKKPISPIRENINKIFTPLFEFICLIHQNLKSKISQISILNKLFYKHKNFKDAILPKTLNNLILNTATIGLKGYKALQSDYRYIRNCLYSKNSIRYFHNILEQANKNITKKNNFRESLLPENFTSNSNSNPTHYNPTYHNCTHTNPIKNIKIENNNSNYELSL